MRHKIIIAFVGVIAAVILGCGKSGGPAGGLTLPATYQGDLPCADCEGIRYHLDLWPDGVFHLRREWLGRDLVQFDLGRWNVDSTRAALVLAGAGEKPIEFEIKSGGKLRLLDVNGKTIESELPYELESAGQLAPVTMSLPLGGELVFLGGELRFQECLTGRNYWLADSGDVAKAQEAAKGANGQPVYVTIDATLKDASVTVRRFINAWPGERCERARATASLDNTYWRIVRLGADAVTATEGHREPHVILKSERGVTRYAATAGCNQLGGGVVSSSDAITFTPGPQTLMACTPDLDALERKLIETLSAAAHWRVVGNTLELTNAAGESIALFQAVYF